MTPHVSCVMCNLEANYTLHKKNQFACVRKKKCCTNSDDAILEPESKFVSTLTFTTAEELEVHDFNAQSINELVDQSKQQVRSNSPTQMPQCSRKLKVQEETSSKELEDLQKYFDTQLLAGYQKENERALIELGQAKSRMLKVLNLFSKAYGPDWEQMIILQMTGSSGSNQQIILENIQPLQSTVTKFKDEEERIEELIKDENN
ncbi:hypothetical protein BY996DRAFT_8536536 [Phakopsora pachyrhizi]|nr:hypothetical protein BY996DRAFT_8536536 [Phakopsora pachyrhizi]